MVRPNHRAVPFEQRPLLGWMDEPGHDKGLRFLAPDGSWQFTSYQALARRVLGLSQHFQRLGLPQGSVVAIALPPSADFAACFFAALHAGATPCPVVPPLPFQRADAYRDHVLQLCATARPELLVTTTALQERVGATALLQAANRVVLLDGDHDLEGLALAASARPPSRHALLQFTSGTAGAPKAVQVPWAALERNIGCIRAWMRMTPGDATATWLPMHHDMGLIGCLLTPVINRSDVYAMRPDQFLRDPVSWLACFGRHGATLTAVPDFALSHVARRVPDSAVADMDFRSWRAVIVGAERIQPGSLDAFARLLGPRGLRRSCFCPAYGLAEACLAVTGLPVDAEPTVVRVAAGGQALGSPVVEVRDPDEPGTDYVGCGPPLGDTTVQIVDDEQRPLPERTLGEIVISSSMLADGYMGAADDDAFRAQSLRTGDAGFVIDGQLHIVGRLGDSIKHRATAIFAEELEAHLAHKLSSVRAHPVVLLGSYEGENMALVLLEAQRAPSARDVFDALANRVPGLRVMLGLARQGTILRTSSGKPRRRAMWQAFLGGSLNVEMVTAHDEAPTPR
jgi:acyl-CoA synthetase (AMP-forming)/AMP-acid ligase II